MRLQRYLARSGVASRRACEKFIELGRVKVNNVCVTELGTKVDPDNDEVTLDGAVIELPQDNVVLMLHKPAGYVSTMSDPQRRATVADLVPTDRYGGLYPIGRLDIDTTGLLLFSTDGELGNMLLHPSHHVVKRYISIVDGTLQKSDIEQLCTGIKLEDGMTLPAEIELLSRDSQDIDKYFEMPEVFSKRSDTQANSLISISIHEGRKRQIRRMFEAVGHHVLALHRVSFGPLALGDLPSGEWRMLTDREKACLYASL